jgi:hypothetical protein
MKREKCDPKVRCKHRVKLDSFSCPYGMKCTCCGRATDHCPIQKAGYAPVAVCVYCWNEGREPDLVFVSEKELLPPESSAVSGRIPVRPPRSDR